MAVELGTGYIQLVPSATGIKGKIEQELDLDSVAKTAGTQAGKTLSKSLITGATAAAAGLAIGKFLKSSFDEAQESQKVGAQTAAVLQSTGAAAHISADQVGELATALSKKAGIDDEVIQSGENVLLTFRNVRNEAGKGNDIFTRGTKVALDMSTALGTDLTSANIQLGKALNDPIKGITALQRVGVSFTAQQKEQIATLVESGNTLGAQKIILRELTSEFGGSAAAQATSADKAKVAIKNLEESVGIALAPAFETAADTITFFTDALSDLPAPLRSIVIDVGLVGAGVLAAAVAAEKFGGAFKLISSGASAVGEALAGTISFLQGFTVAEVAAAAAAVAIPAALFAIGIALDQSIGEGAKGAFPGLISQLEDAKKKGSTWADGIIAGAKASGSPVAELTNRLNSLRASRDAELAAGHEGALSQEEGIAVASKYHVAITQVKGALDSAKDAQIQAAAAARESKAAIDAYSGALSSGATQTQALAAAGDKGREAIQALNNALLAAAGGAVNYDQAVQNQTSAQEAYTAAVNQFTADSPQAAAALTALHSANLGVAQAAEQNQTSQAELTQELFKTKGAYDEHLKNLYAQIQASPEAAAGILLQKDALDKAKAAADAMPGSKSIVVTADTAQAIAAISDVGAAIARLPSNITAVLHATGLFDGRASGGPVTGGTPYLVGEQGPEFFVPKDSGTIIPARQSAALLAGTSVPTAGGGGLNVAGDLVVRDTSVIPDLDYYAKTRLVGV